METTHYRQSVFCALLLSKGHYLHRMSHTQKQTNMLLCIRGLSGPCSLKLSWWILFLLAAFISQEHQSLPGREAWAPSKETCAGARLCCGTPGTRMPEKYRPGNHSSSFCCIYPGNTDNYIFILNDSLILIKGLGRRLSTCSKIKRNQTALYGVSGQSCEKQQGVELQLAAPFCNQPGRGTAAQWALMSSCSPLFSLVAVTGLSPHSNREGTALHTHMLLLCSNAPK